MKSFILLSLSMFVFSNSAMANECYDKSPNFIQFGDKYFSTESTVKISDSDKGKLRNLISKLSGNWEGNVSVIDCKGTEKNPKKVEKFKTVTLEIPDQDKLKFKAKIFTESKGTIKTRIYKLLRQNEIFNYKFKNENNLIFSDVKRVSNVTRGARLVENIYNINVTEYTLTFTILWYNSGVFTGNETWTMTRSD